MEHPGFFDRAGPVHAGGRSRARLGAELRAWRRRPSAAIVDVRPLDEAGPGHLTFLDNSQVPAAAAARRSAGACLVAPAFADRVPPATVALVTQVALSRLRAGAARCSIRRRCAHRRRTGRGAVQPRSHPTAGSRRASMVEPGAVVGRRGAGSAAAPSSRPARSSATACTIGRDCFIGPGATVIARADRRPRDPACRRAHRPGRLRLRHGRRAATSRCRRSAG